MRPQPGMLLRRAGLLREQLARARGARGGAEQPVASSSPAITTVARTPDVQIETAPGDARPQGAMLMRDFLRASLYDPDRGYFSRPVPPVGRLPEPIDFSKLVGQAEYRAVLARAHASSAARGRRAAAREALSSSASASSGDGSDNQASAAAGAADAGRLLGGGDWLTPAEIFRPWYGAAVAHYVLEAHALEGRRRRQAREQQGREERQTETAAAARSSSSGGSRREGQQQQQQQQQQSHQPALNRKLTPMLHHDRAPQTAASVAVAAAGADLAATDEAAASAAPAAAPPFAPNQHQQHHPADPLYIVEIGGGTGALALSVLDHIRAVAPQEVYDRTTYVCVEVSAPLAAAQRSAVAVEGGHARAFVSVVGDATERSTWDAVGRAVPGMPIVRSGGGAEAEGEGEVGESRRGGGGGGSGGSGDLPSSSSSSPSLADDRAPPPPRVFVLAMEVLDNLPHDRIERAAPGQPWLQTAVAPKSPRAATRLPSSSSRGGWGGGGQRQQQQQQQWRQVLQPVTDPLVAGCARVVLPLLASAAGGDPSSPAVLAGIGGDEGDEEEGRDGAGGRGRRPDDAAADGPAASSSAAALQPPITSSSASWGWDPATWLRRLLAAATGEQLDPVAAWLPTGALALVRCLHGALPATHTLVASDFDALPGVQVEGHGAPIVSGRRVEEEEESRGEGGEESGSGSDGEEVEEGREGGGRKRRALLRRRLVARDHAGVLVPWGTADIFFPTDFDALSALYVSAADANEPPQPTAAARSPPPARRRPASAPVNKAACQHMPTADFMAAFAESKRTRTLSGYNPLLQDFKNTRFFIGEARRGG